WTRRRPVLGVARPLDRTRRRPVLGVARPLDRTRRRPVLGVARPLDRTGRRPARRCHARRRRGGEPARRGVATESLTRRHDRGAGEAAMRVALVSEGTYPFAVGGVSTWCDQLIRGLPEHRWEMVALTVDGTEQPRWPRPENLDAVHQIPLWAPASAGAHRPGSAFLSSWQNLATAMLAPDDPRSPEAMVARSRFVLALRGLYEFAADGGDLVTALTSNAALEVLVSAWRQSRG